MISLLVAVAFQATNPAPAPVWGVTIDNLAQLSEIVPALAGFKAKPTARVVFDPGTTPSDYAAALQQLAPVANIMGEPIDSAPPSGDLTVAQYVSRMTEFMTQLSSNVGVWEIGNEVNGNWTCGSAEMAQKISGTLAVAQKLHVKTALTLFYSDDFVGTDRDLVTWSQTFLPAAVRNGVDYVLVSYYPTSVTGGPYWRGIFRQLGWTFPNAKLGFGELGLANPDGTLNTNMAAKAQLVREYYTEVSHFPGRFIQGLFWWTFAEDAVPKGTGLWSTFNSVIH